MNKADKIWMDGKFVDWKDANIHILTHGLHYGSAVFEGIHSYKTDSGVAVFRLREHIDRLFHSAAAISLDCGFTKEEVVSACLEALRVNKLDNAYVRPLMYYGSGILGVFPQNAPHKICIITVPWGEYYAKNLNVSFSKFVRPIAIDEAFGAKISGNYANSIMAMYEARKKGFDEALMVDEKGFVSEGPVENFFLVKDGKLVTPKSRGALHGITRDSLITLSKDLGIEVEERDVTKEEVFLADELFFCGTATEIAPIVSVDGKKISDDVGPVTKKIKEYYLDVVHGKVEKYKPWLSFV